MKPTLKAPETKRLKLENCKLLSSFAFKFNVRRCIEVNSSPSLSSDTDADYNLKTGMLHDVMDILGRGLHSSSFS